MLYGSAMHWFLTLLSLALLGFVQALSSSGTRLLVVTEDSAGKDNYSLFWRDLESTHIPIPLKPSYKVDDIVNRSRLPTFV